MDGLRKVPDNVPEQEMLTRTSRQAADPDPRPVRNATRASQHHNNAMLRHFLDRFGFDYEFLSATDCYTSGRFDEAIRSVLRNWDDDHGRDAADPARGTPPDLFADPASLATIGPRAAGSGRGHRRRTGHHRLRRRGRHRVEQSALGGQAKLQWKVDWAARWVALGVDYEMAGKDLIDSVMQSSQIARVLGGRPPEGFNYEMFLDEKGEKISKSKGNGLSLEEWLRYGSEREPRLLHLPRAEEGEEPAPWPDPASRRRILAVPRQLSATSRSSRSSATRCTTSTAARCRRRACR